MKQKSISGKELSSTIEDRYPVSRNCVCKPVPVAKVLWSLFSPRFHTTLVETQRGILSCVHHGALVSFKRKL